VTTARGEERRQLTRGTLFAAAFSVGVAQLALAISAVLQGLFQKDLGTSSSQLTWISDAFLVPVTLLELTFGVLGDLFGRKRLLVIGAAMLAVGQGIALLTPGLGTSTGTRVAVLWIGMAVTGCGAAAIMPTSPA
jgi:MFS family permease